MVCFHHHTHSTLILLLYTVVLFIRNKAFLHVFLRFRLNFSTDLLMPSSNLLFCSYEIPGFHGGGGGGVGAKGK